MSPRLNEEASPCASSRLGIPADAGRTYSPPSRGGGARLAGGHLQSRDQPGRCTPGREPMSGRYRLSAPSASSMSCEHRASRWPAARGLRRPRTRGDIGRGAFLAAGSRRRFSLRTRDGRCVPLSYQPTTRSRASTFSRLWPDPSAEGAPWRSTEPSGAGLPGRE